MASSSSLPAEIWIQFCEGLCLHCHMPKNSNSIPDFRTADARAGKATLKALCLVSREFRAISQDILFHYFLNDFQDELSWKRGVNKNRAPSFLRALIHNPPLGRRVRMMSLLSLPFSISNPCQPDIKRQDLEAWIRVSASHDMRVPTEVIRALAGGLVCDDAPRLLFDEPGPSAQLRLSNGTDPSVMIYGRTKMHQVFDWLQVLILNHVPHLTDLQLGEPMGWLDKYQNSPRIFSQLRELTYDGYQDEDLIESLALFPNLHSLGARYHCFARPREIKCPMPTTNIRKLSINGCPAGLSLILRLCPYLEDLECHVDPNSWDINHVAGVQWPAHTKSTLRRLAWSNRDYIGDWTRNEYTGFVRTCSVPLQAFERLEILEIDHVSLFIYSKSLGAKTPSSVLPKSLRILHIAFSQGVVSQRKTARQLLAIASARAMDLPNLSIVKVGDPPRRGSEKKKLADFLHRTGVIGVMKDASIELRIGKEAENFCYNRSILSHPPGSFEDPMGPTFHDEVFSLDDI